MGLFSRLFGSTSRLEEKLEGQYVPMLQATMGLSTAKAKKTFRDMLEKARQESVAEGSSKLPRDYGDILLRRESTDEQMRRMIAKKRNEGVKDEDIRWWWNMHDLERRMMVQWDELSKMAMFVDSLKKGMSDKEAAERVRKCFPIYGHAEDTSQVTGDDRPLPAELKNRVLAYSEKRRRSDPQEYVADIENSSTYNSLVRQGIREGLL